LLAGVFERLLGKVDVGGEELIPEKGSFVLAVNHFHGAWTPFVTAAVLAALKRRRADVVDDMAMVIGQRADTKRKRFFVARWVRAIMMWVLDRWQHNVLRIPLGNTNVSIDQLRTWRRVATARPSLVFPEGLASITFEKVRPGAGQFVRALGVPVVPCAVWYHQGQWHVEFDAPIAWAKSPELSDLQVGLSIARLLPADLTPSWRGVLDRWQRAHYAPAD
jgi:1-acyl-sn-glycerol-3-phosphate acyltransferase